MAAVCRETLPCRRGAAQSVEELRARFGTAPQGTPEVLAGAYDAVAAAALLAAENWHNPPQTLKRIADAAESIESTIQQAEDLCRKAEIWLRAGRDAQGRCAHQASLDFARRLRDALAYIRSGALELVHSAGLLRSVEAIDLPASFDRMRTQLSSASVRWFHEARTAPAQRPTGSAGPVCGPPTAQRPARVSAVVLTDKGEYPKILGEPVRDRLSPKRRDVLRAVIEAGPEGLTGPELVRKTGYEDAVNIFKRLRGKSRLWKKVLLPSGEKRHGYRVLFVEAPPGFNP
jgi:hypothetical protein